MSKATLVFPVKTATSGSTAYEITITRYTSGYQTQLDNSTTRNQRHGYPRRIKEMDINITSQCRSVAEYDDIRTTMAVTQRLSLVDVDKALVRFIYPKLNLDYLGFIPLIPGGISRFVAAPQLTFTFSLFKDTINTIANQYSSANGTWKDIAGSDLVVVRTPSDDEVLGNFTPHFDNDGGFINSPGTRPVF